jgi:hypothetical protein
MSISSANGNADPISITDANRGLGDDAVEGDHRVFGGPTADVHHHVAGRRVDRQSHADRGRDRLRHQMHRLAASRAHGRIDHGALLHLGDAGGDADDDAGSHQTEELVLLHPVDERVQEVFGHLEIGDDPVLERSHRIDVVGRAAEHDLRFHADREHSAAGLVDGDHRGLVEHDAATPHVQQGVRGPQVHRHIGGQKPHQAVEEEHPCLMIRWPMIVGG